MSVQQSMYIFKVQKPEILTFLVIDKVDVSLS